MRTAVLLGGTGQIGTAISNRLLSLGWSVTVTSRCQSPNVLNAQHSVVDASDLESLLTAFSKPTDLLVSCVAFDLDDADRLLRVANNVGRVVVISSASVYQDIHGKTLDEARENGFPDFKGPIDENTQTVLAGPETYSTRKIAMERRLLEQDVTPVNILRPCAVHGPLSKHAREWWFVKRILDGRKRIPLAYMGKSRFQTTSVGAIADLVVLASNEKLPVITNVCDADSPSVIEIGQTIAQIMNAEVEFVGLDTDVYPPVAGATPWSLPNDFILTSNMPGKLRYADTVLPTIEWLTNKVGLKDWKEMLPQLAQYPYEHFDYGLDDTVV